MLNLNLIEHQPRWRVAIVAHFAQLTGVLIHVEGIPFGSNRCWTKQAYDRMGEATQGEAGIAGGFGQTAQEKT